MLHPFTWQQYFTAVVLLCIIYYALIIFRRYRPELQKLVSRFNRDKTEGHLPNVLRYEETATATAHHPLANREPEELFTSFL